MYFTSNDLLTRLLYTSDQFHPNNAPNVSLKPLSRRLDPASRFFEPFSADTYTTAPRVLATHQLYHSTYYPRCLQVPHLCSPADYSELAQSMLSDLEHRLTCKTDTRSLG